MAVKVRRMVDRHTGEPPNLRNLPPHYVKTADKYQFGKDQLLVVEVPRGEKPYQGSETSLQHIIPKNDSFNIPYTTEKEAQGRTRRCTECGSPFRVKTKPKGCVSCGNDNKRKTEMKTNYREKTKIDKRELIQQVFRLDKNRKGSGTGGYYQVYRIGGRNPRVEYLFKGFIHKADHIGKVTDDGQVVKPQKQKRTRKTR